LGALTITKSITPHVLNERHLKRLMSDYIRYYHKDRTYLALEKGAPAGRQVENRPGLGGRIVAMPRRAACIIATILPPELLLPKSRF
jgi:hypothetical protein